MAKFFRWLLRLLVAAAVLSLAALWMGYWLAARSLPDYDATYRVSDPVDQIEIVRDNADVPHIFGVSDREVYYGLGFAHAQDRLWQMMMMRRTAQGKLSEVFGRTTLASDELMRRLDIYRLAQASLSAQSPQTQAALQAYSDGVNAWLREVNAGARGRGAPEFFFYPFEIAPWQPSDSIALLKLVAVQNAYHLKDEVLRARVSLTLSQDRVRDILPDTPGAGTMDLPRYGALFPQLHNATTEVAQADLAFLHFAASPFGAASNVWAAGPARSASGGTLLANDPHMDLTAPAPMYLARLELSSGGVIGATMPGVPAILSGRSAALGWGIAAAFTDDMDLHIEQVNPDNPREVQTPTGYAPLTTRPSIIRIKDAEPITLQRQWSQNGPILPPSVFDLGTITPPGYVVSLSATVLSEADTSITAALDIMGAQTVDEGITASHSLVAPAMNIVFADARNIAMVSAGAVPLRDPANQSLGRLPTPGWADINRWHGWMDVADWPVSRNPAGGLIGNTNNKTVNRPFPEHMSYLWGDTQRILRWSRLMQSREVHTRESFIEAQNDTVSNAARALLPLVAADLWYTGEAAPEGTLEERRKQALDMLAAWNGEMSEHLPEPLIYSAWMRALQQRLIQDELGPLAAKFTHVDPVFIERVYRNAQGAAIWCDVLQSAADETCTDIARLALDDALLWIDQTYGGALESLQWGTAHEAQQNHGVLGRMPVLRWFVNLRQPTSGGDNTLQRGVTRGTGRDPFVNVHAAVYRGVYDFADPDSSVFVLSSGQSGHFLSRHYDDLGEQWRRGEYVPMSLDPELARAAATGVTVIRSQGESGAR
ncbi:Acyl-homoserine lactone acylase QuiP precursor [Aquimixticola soesokkakensis]|uniref:Acyl-homoserine lactone acylase QuiP n=1 Tax=Aquimixticola soesokkakensis TaxID=1519096 RepID=A0A1Y5SIM2_9RHOB|nr:penicillin acylase family protein [Aquimixticola soesokkakensis]SLN41690.1 Acyl-homoserine lactone acylase QuiP precursor [Aquimixticola soesokkakensis]